MTAIALNGVASLACVAQAAVLPQKPNIQKPNIVFVLADDMGMECLGCYGSQFYKTPNLDKLAAEGVLFREAYSQPKCTPSRVQLLTGKHNFRNYIDFGSMDLTQKTFAQSLKSIGYKTYIAGKWQLSPDNFQGPYTAGFDGYCLWHFAAEGKPSGERYKSPVLYLDGKKMEGLVGKYGPDITLEKLIDFIKSNKDQPFLAYYTSILPHFPFMPTPDSVDWAKNDKSRGNLAHFKEMVEYLDKQVGTLVKTLDDLHLREKTLIVFTGDNGTETVITSPFPSRGEIRGGKGQMIDDGNHVGFIANWPGVIQPGTVVKTQIEFTDVFPTFCAVSGAPMPAGLDGQNLFPFMLGNESKARGWVFQSYDPKGISYRCFTRQGPYKLYSSGEFYNVPTDWLEENPLPASPETVQIREKLKGLMDSMLKGYDKDKINTKPKFVGHKNQKKTQNNIPAE